MLNGQDGKLRIFFTRNNYFYLYENGKFNKINYEFKLEAEPVNKRDKEFFFDYIESVNQTKYPKQTKNSIDFPKSKEFFLGVMTWGNKFALIEEKGLIVVSNEGRRIEKIKFPEEIKVESRWEFLYPERRMRFHNNVFYFYDENKDTLKIFNVE